MSFFDDMEDGLVDRNGEWTESFLSGLPKGSKQNPNSGKMLVGRIVKIKTSNGVLENCKVLEYRDKNRHRARYRIDCNGVIKHNIKYSQIIL